VPLCPAFYFIYLFIFAVLGFELSLHLKPLHQPFVMGFILKLFAQAGFEQQSS
jgi:hypothetical protein